MNLRIRPSALLVSILLMLTLVTTGWGRGLGGQTTSLPTRIFQISASDATTTSTSTVLQVGLWDQSTASGWSSHWRNLQATGVSLVDPQPSPTLAEPLPLPKLSVADAETFEGNAGLSYLRFVVSLDGLANGYVDVTYSTADVTASLVDHDYVASNGTVTIPPGFSSAEVLVGIRGDTKVEADETLTLTLSDVSANAVLDRALAIGTIYSEELPGNKSELLPPVPRGVISHGAKGRPIDKAILENPNVTGFLVLQGWNDIEPAEGVFDWEHIDSEVARAKAAGKVVKLTIHAGGDSAPAWLLKNYPQIKPVIWYDKVTGERLSIPAYWDPAYIRIKNRFIEAMGNRYGDTDTIFATSVSMIDPNTNDWAFVVRDMAQKQSYLDAGFSEAVFINAYKQLIDTAMAAFPKQYVVTAVGPIPRILVKDKFAAVHQVLDDAYAAYGDRLIIAKGALHAAIPEPAEADGTAWETMLIYSPNTAGQFVWSVTRDPQYKMNGKVEYTASESPAIFRKAAEKGKQYGMRWIEPWRIDLLNPVLQDEIAYAARLLSED